MKFVQHVHNLSKEFIKLLTLISQFIKCYKTGDISPASDNIFEANILAMWRRRRGFTLHAVGAPP